jgi:hypothetical protein
MSSTSEMRQLFDRWEQVWHQGELASFRAACPRITSAMTNWAIAQSHERLTRLSLRN